jgi:hypothetical protein
MICFDLKPAAISYIVDLNRELMGTKPSILALILHADDHSVFLHSLEPVARPSSVCVTGAAWELPLDGAKR